MFVPGAAPQSLLERVERAAGRLRHRGPDGEGFFQDGAVVLGHRRLIVLDPEGGRQPFADPRGRAVCVFNGEIYNHQDLRRELESLGERFETRSDTEVFLKAFIRWGTGAFERADGMFAAAFWSKEERTLTLARDRAGEKPLFYSESPGAHTGLAFASEILSLLALLEKTPGLDPRGLWSYLTLGYARAPRILEGIRQIPPGSYLTARDGVVVEDGRYWAPRPRPREISEEDALPLIREAAGRAVKSRLESDVPLGAFLSGGVDSSIIIYEMRRAGIKDLQTFTVGFSGGEGYDESPWAKQVAGLFKTRHHEQIVDADAPLLESVLDALDEPMADSSAIGVWALARHARHQITVALGGDGGDEVFCGYERFTGVELTEKLPKFLRHALRPLAPLVPNTGGYGNRGERLRRVLREGWRDPIEKLLRWQSMSPPEQALLLLRPELRPQGVFTWPVALPMKTPFRLHELLRANFESYLPDDLLVKTDRMAMSHSLELRSPFLAKDVIELGLSLPARGLLSGRSLKHWLKAAYRGILPDAILDRRKHGFGMPVHLWLRGKLKDWAAERILDPRSPLWRYLDGAAVQALWHGHQSGKLDAGQRLYGLLVLDHWLRRISP